MVRFYKRFNSRVCNMAALRIVSMPALEVELHRSGSLSLPSLASKLSSPAASCNFREAEPDHVGSACTHSAAESRSAVVNENLVAGWWRGWCTSGSTAGGMIPIIKTFCLPMSCLPVHKFDFTTAAINILEPGKHWKGKGWNRVGVEEIPVSAIKVNRTSASNFDCIPDLEEKLQFLETCGLGIPQLGQMRKLLPSAVKNTFLKLSLKKLFEVANFLEEEVGVQKKDFGNLLFANPYIAGSSVDDCLRPKINFLRDRGITKEQMGKMVVRAPQLLTYSLEGKLMAIEKKLVEVGLKADEIAKVFVKYPAVFGTSLKKFDRNLTSLKDGGITVTKAICRIPQIMSLTLDTKFEHVTQYMREELRLKPEQIAKIISHQVSILSFSVKDNISPKVNFFAELGFQQDDIARLILRYPNVFCHSLENSIKPKVLYLRDVMHRDVVELISFPQYLSYSLSARIIPRYEYVTEHGFTFKLSSLLTCNEKVYEKRYRKRAKVLSCSDQGMKPVKSLSQAPLTLIL